MKIKFFKKEETFKKENFVFHSGLYWEIIVLIAFIMIILSFLFGYNLFTQVNQESSSSNSNGSGQVPTISKDRLGTDLNYFSDRAQKSAEILSSPSTAVDPSL